MNMNRRNLRIYLRLKGVKEYNMDRMKMRKMRIIMMMTLIKKNRMLWIEEIKNINSS